MRSSGPDPRETPVPRHPSPAFSWPVRVYHEDTDGSGLVYHANYLKRGSRIVVGQAVRRGAETLATARVQVACVNTVNLKPVRIPGGVSVVLARYAAK